MMKGVVVITGATGRLGELLGGFLSARGYAPRGICLNSRRVAGITTADLRFWDEAWASRFEGAAAIVHLAGHPSPEIDWRQAHENVAMTVNVLEAARRARVPRIVFASSNWVMAGYRFRSGAIDASMPPRPINAYGTSKYVGEELGRSFVLTHGARFFALRIGYVTPDGRHGPHLLYGAWGQQMWLSPDDFCAACWGALHASAGPPFGICNVVSANEGMRWTLDEARALIGYDPSRTTVPRVGYGQRLTQALAHGTFRAGARLQSAWTHRKW